MSKPETPTTFIKNNFYVSLILFKTISDIAMLKYFVFRCLLTFNTINNWFYPLCEVVKLSL